jgi:Flp pilus assembly pilin Flp
MKSMLARLIRSDSGQDIVEYAFLAAFFGVVGYLVVPPIVTAVRVTYLSWTSTATGVPSLWDPPVPGAGT